MDDPLLNTCRTCSETLKFHKNLCESECKPLLDLMNRLIGYEAQKITTFNICYSCESKLKWILEFKDLCEKTAKKFGIFASQSYKEEVVDIDDIELINLDAVEKFDCNLDSSFLEDAFQSDGSASGNFPVTLKKRVKSDSSDDSDVPIIRRQKRKRKSIKKLSKNIFDVDKRPKCTKRSYYLEKIVDDEASEKGKLKEFRLDQFPAEKVEKALKEFLKPFEENRVCVLCKELISSRSRLAWHMSARHKDVFERWCYICNTIVTNLDDHKTVHNDLFKCPICEKQFKTDLVPFKDHIGRHTDAHVEWDFFPCKYCPKSFPFLNELIDHQCPNVPPDTEVNFEQLKKPKKTRQNKWKTLQDKRIRQFSFEQVERALKETTRFLHTIRKCAVCEDILNNFKELSDHMQTNHSQLKDGWCERCNKIVDNLEDHKSTHTVEDGETCCFCKIKVKTKTKLQNHLMMHSNSPHFKPKLDWFSCTICPKAFPYENELQNHNCDTDTKENIVISTNQILSVNKREETLNNENALTAGDDEWLVKKVNARKWSKLIRVPFDVVEKVVREAMRPFYTFRLCPVCHFTCKHRSALGTHITTKHKDVKHTWCNRCNAMIEDLEEHLKSHSAYMYNCTFCEKRFNRRDDFCEHMLRHALTGHKFNEKWYCCSECPGSFMFEDELKEHKCLPVALIMPDDSWKTKTAAKIVRQTRSTLEQFPHDVVEKAMKELMRPIYTIRECPVCGKIKPDRRILTSHIGVRHKDVKNKWCNRCNALVDNLPEHVAKNHDECGFHCILCKRQFTSLNCGIQEHMNRHSLSCGRKIANKWFNCANETCPSSFPYEDQLSEHKCPATDEERQQAREELQIQLRTKIEPLPENKKEMFPTLMKTCPVCNKEVKYLLYHLKTEHKLRAQNPGNGRSQIELENLIPVPIKKKKKYVSKRKLKKGTQSADDPNNPKSDPDVNTKGILCSYCGKLCQNNSALQIHLFRHTGERPYKCSYCGKGLVSKHSLKIHEEAHAGERNYICDVCGKVSPSRSALFSHKLIHGSQPLECPICGTFVSRPYLLKVHMKRHTDARRYSCAHCDAAYHLKRLLLKHLAKHSNKRYKCEFCDKTFIHEEYLKTHSRMHNGQYPFLCTLCPFSTNKSYKLTRHMVKHPEDAPQANNPYKCPMCFRSFSTRAVQVSHTRNNHMSFVEKILKPPEDTPTTCLS